MKGLACSLKAFVRSKSNLRKKEFYEDRVEYKLGYYEEKWLDHVTWMKDVIHSKNFLAFCLSEDEDQTFLDGYELYLQNRPFIGLTLQREGHGI